MSRDWIVAMGNSKLRAMCCFLSERERATVGEVFSDPLDEGLGHSFCYVRPPIPFSSSSNSSSLATDSSFSVSLPSDDQIPPLQQQQQHTHDKGISEKSFKSISGASVSANTSNPRSLPSHEQFHSFPINPCDRAAAFESTPSFTALPLQPAPRGIPYSGSLSGPLSVSCPLDRGFASGSLLPLEKASFMSGPLERGFMSGPLERSYLSGSLDPVDRSISSAPTGIPYSGHIQNSRKAFARFVRVLSKPVKKALSKTFSGVLSRKNVLEKSTGIKQKEDRVSEQISQEMGYCLDAGEKSNLQWAQAMAGEDRVHIVLCEEHGWLFVGIYDGFNGPDAPDFLMSNLYPAVYRELEGLLWDQTNSVESSIRGSRNQQPKTDNRKRRNQKRVSAHEILGILDSWKKDLNAANGKKRAAAETRNPDAAIAKADRPKAAKRVVQMKRHKDGCVDHYAVLKALSRALKATEKAYLDMADRAVAENPELALVGSCILVMLMKDEDVYIINVGDSRALLAQQAASADTSFDCSNLLSRAGKSHGQINHCKEDHERIVARDSMLRIELERIIEETPMELEDLEQSFDPSEMAPPPAISSTLNALQLTSDHSTSIQQEVIRIMMEHPDDDAPVYNDRVKGRLKVTRAFGAGFLKNPKWNEALLEMFRINYVGTAPYINCVPAMHHHKLGPLDRFLVLSSDGLYQYLTNEEVISHVEWFMEQFPEGDPAQYLIEELLFRAAKKAGMDFQELLEIPQGDRRKYHDDVSVMVISLEGRVWRSFS